VDDLDPDGYGSVGDSTTEDQNKRLDVLSHETMIHFLTISGQLCVGASPESDGLIVPPRELTGEYCVAFDPLDVRISDYLWNPKPTICDPSVLSA
jgi:fructose-1,6-bisphosphatase